MSEEKRGERMAAELRIREKSVVKEKIQKSPNSAQPTTYSREKEKPRGIEVVIDVDRRFAGRSLLKQVAYLYVARYTLPDPNEFFWNMFRSSRHGWGYGWGQQLHMGSLLMNSVLAVIGYSYLFLHIRALIQYYCYMAENVFLDLGNYQNLPPKRAVLLLFLQLFFTFTNAHGSELRELSIPFHLCGAAVVSFISAHSILFLIQKKTDIPPPNHKRPNAYGDS